MKTKIVIPVNKKILNMLYTDCGFSMRRIANIFHVSHKVISKYIKKYEISKRERYFSYHKININEELLRNLYINQKKSIIEIGKEFKIGKWIVLNRLNEFNIPIGTPSESHRGQHSSPSTEFKKGQKCPWKDMGIEDNVKQKISESRIGDKNPNWQGGIQNYLDASEFRKIRKIVLNRDRNICQLCSTGDKKLQVHHLIPYRISEDNSIENLISLCSSCHGKVEQYYRKYPNDYMKIFYEIWSN